MAGTSKSQTSRMAGILHKSAHMTRGTSRGREGACLKRKDSTQASVLDLHHSDRTSSRQSKHMRSQFSSSIKHNLAVINDQTRATDSNRVYVGIHQHKGKHIRFKRAFHLNKTCATVSNQRSKNREYPLNNKARISCLLRASKAMAKHQHLGRPNQRSLTR